MTRMKKKTVSPTHTYRRTPHGFLARNKRDNLEVTIALHAVGACGAYTFGLTVIPIISAGHGNSFSFSPATLGQFPPPSFERSTWLFSLRFSRWSSRSPVARRSVTTTETSFASIKMTYCRWTYFPDRFYWWTSITRRIGRGTRLMVWLRMDRSLRLLTRWNFTGDVDDSFVFERLVAKKRNFIRSK